MPIGTLPAGVDDLPDGTASGQPAVWNGTEWIAQTNLNLGSGFIGIGSGNLATAGLLRVANDVAIVAARNAANSANITLLETDENNYAYVGGSQTGTLLPERLITQATTQHETRVGASAVATFTSTLMSLGTGVSLAGPGTVATVGLIRAANATVIAAARNAANNANIEALSTDSSNNTILDSPAGVLIKQAGNTRATITDNLILAAAINIQLANNTALQGRNAANTAWVTIGTVASTNEVVIGTGSNGITLNHDVTIPAGADLKMANNRAVYFKDSGGNYQEILSYNSSNQVEIGGSVYSPGYAQRGDLYRAAAAGSFAADGTAKVITGWTGSNATASDVLVSAVNGTLTVGAAGAGVYRISATGKWYVQSGDGDLITVTFNVTKNGTALNGFSQDLSASSSGGFDGNGIFGFDGLVSLANSDVIRLTVTLTTEGGATVAVIPDALFSIKREA